MIVLSAMKIRAIREVRGYQVHYADDQRCLASKALTLYESYDLGETWQPVCHLPSSLCKSLPLHFSLYARLIRGGVHSVLPIQTDPAQGWIIVADRKLFYLPDHEQKAEIIFHINRGRRPLRRGVAILNDQILAGEYWRNPGREPVNLHRIRAAGRRSDVLYRFDQGRVRHIHAVEVDPYSQLLWVATGDADSECMIITIDPQSAQANIVGYGSQKWRTASFAMRPDAVYWGTDNHLGENQVRRYVRATNTTEKVADVTGPVYYNVCMDEAVIFGTTMEKGEGQQDGFGRLYALNNRGIVEEVWRQKKDRWDVNLFGYGVFEFAEGRLSGNRFWVTARGFEGGLRSILFKLEDDN